jgi:hypothetical protein
LSPVDEQEGFPAAFERRADGALHAASGHGLAEWKLACFAIEGFGRTTASSDAGAVYEFDTGAIVRRDADTVVGCTAITSVVAGWETTVMFGFRHLMSELWTSSSGEK